MGSNAVVRMTVGVVLVGLVGARWFSQPMSLEAAEDAADAAQDRASEAMERQFMRGAFRPPLPRLPLALPASAAQIRSPVQQQLQPPPPSRNFQARPAPAPRPVRPAPPPARNFQVQQAPIRSFQQQMSAAVNFPAAPSYSQQQSLLLARLTAALQAGELGGSYMPQTQPFAPSFPGYPTYQRTPYMGDMWSMYDIDQPDTADTADNWG